MVFSPFTMNKSTYYIIGLMSGSSLDGLDIAYCKFELEGNKVYDWQLLAAETIPYDEMWQARLAHLPTQSALILAKTDVYFGYYMGELVQSFIAKYKIEKIDAIASHGHTIFHQPENQFTLQIGSGAALSASTQQNVICDFRLQDIASGGQGAPLAPLVDEYLWSGRDFYINLGGIANIAATIADKTIGFDICYCNQVLNHYAQLLGFAYDKGGFLAKAGQIQDDLLTALQALPFFKKKYPKSLGNEWIRNEVIPFIEKEFGHILPIDVLATTTAHIAYEIAKAMQKIIQIEGLSKSHYKILLTGGGAHNTFLKESIQKYLAFEASFEALSIEIIDFKEAILMALLGALRWNGQKNMPIAATGAKFQHSAGAIYRYQ